MNRLILFIVSGMLLLSSGVRADFIELKDCFENEKSWGGVGYSTAADAILNKNPIDLGKKKEKIFKWSKENYEISNYIFLNLDNKSADPFNDNLSYYEWDRKFYNNELNNPKKYKKIKMYEKNIYSINTVNSILTHLWIYSDDYLDYLRSKQNSKKVTEKTFWEKNNSEIYKITRYADKTAIASNSNLYFDTEYVIDLKNNTILKTVYTVKNSKRVGELHSYTPKMVCNNTSNSSGGAKEYLDYWWALILIAAIIFFIYTQTAKELKIKK